MEKTIKYLENGEYHYATVRSVGDLAQLKTDSKETLVEAINELWNGGGNADPSKAPKPEGYDQLVQDVADAVKNQQEISQQWIEWQNEEAQLTEERKQAYLQAMKEMQEAIDKAKADAAALDDKTTKLDEQITKTFSDLDTSIQNMHEQLQKEADRMNQELIDTKSDLTKVRTDLQNAQLDNGRIHDELTNINGKFEHKVWQTDLDPLKAQIDRAETSVQQTKDELLGKASREDLDTVTNAVSKLDTQLKETAKGVEISVKKDELGGDVARLLNDKTNLLLGTRNFAGDKWSNLDHWHEEPGYWNGLKVYSSEQQYYGIQYQYYVRAGNTYTFSLWAKQDVENLQAAFYLLAENKEGIVDPLKQENVIVKTEWTRVHITFDALQDAFIYPRLEQTVVKNKLYVAGYKLELGKNATPWEPNEADIAENIEHTESQFNVYSDQIAGIVKKQEKMGDTERQLDTRITETAEGLKQTSKDLQDANGKITEFKGQLESTAHGLKTEYEKYTNDAIGQISDSTLNLIRNSSFQNKDEDFDQWQNISAKANVRSDENGLRWVELTQSGLTTNNPEGITSNYFNIKQGKVTVAVDIKSGDKASLDNDSVLSLELYNDVKKRVDFYDVSLSELGLNKELLGDHKVHRGLYRLGIDRNDAKYMTVKAKLVKNGDLYFTNFSARLSSIDDGAYEPNPDDLNQQILKQNTKIEQNSKEVAIKANSVDVTRDIKSAVDNVQVGGTNLLKNSVGPFQPHTDHPIDNYSEYHDSVVELVNGEQYTISGTTNGVFSQEHNPSQESDKCVLWLVDDAGINQIVSDENTAKGTTFTWNHPTKKYVLRVNTYHPGSTNQIKAWKIKIEKGNKATDWSPAPEDVSEEIKSAKDAAIQVASDQISIHVNEISTQFDDKLNKRINEQKTASEKFTTDGIEQTVTKITNVKNDVDRLGEKVNGISVGTSNLLHNSDTFDGWIRGASTNISGKYLNGSVAILGGAGVNGGQITTNLDGPNDNALLTWSVYAKADIAGDKFHTELWGGGGSTDQPLTTDWKLYKFSGRRNANHPDFYLWGIIGNKGNIYVSLPVAVIGNTIGSWTPNSEDINKKIDTQVLDSANINDMKTQGHYFVKSLTGNPLAGWVYVDVMGFDGRIRQDVYQDGDSKHMYRRLFGSNWSGWEQGAYISDVKTEVTASVKNLGDRVITQVNSVETRVNNKVDNLKAGGDNLIRNGDANAYNATPWENTNFGKHEFYYNGTKNMFVITTSAKTELTSGSNWFPIKAGQQYTLYFNGFMSNNVSSYDVWLLGKKAGADGSWTNSFNVIGGERLSPSRNCIITRTFTVPNDWNNFVAFLRFDNNGSTDGQNSVFFFNEVSLKEGNINVGYSANPDDTIEAIKEVNTKWDVANGQIQGKVTESQVNNILNGKGYATQSWAETMFQMKKNSITLQAVRDNITNGIQNQVNSTNDRINDTNNRLNNLKIGGTNLLKGTSDTPRRLQGSGYLCKTTASDIYTSTADFHNGDQFTYSATITNNSNHPVSLEMWLFNGREKGHTASNINSHSEIVPAHTQNRRVSATITITSDTWWVRTYVVYSDGHGVDGETVDVSNEKLEVGNVATDWSPAPEDSKNYTDNQITNTNKKIDTQTLDSANIDDLKTQGHYFVRNLTGNPIGGWVYVDVTGNNNDRLKQDVYQDSGYEHKSRRWFGSYWTEWTTDVNNKNVVSQINITPDQIKIASNKIVIDGNTDIHGDLRTDRVRLVGKQGAIDMTGDTGIKLTNNDGSSMLLGRGNIDLMYKNDFRMNIDSSLMTIMQRNQFTDQNKPIAILNIGASWNHSYEKIRGADIRYNPGNVNDVNLHGADYLALSYNKPNLTPGEANIKPQLVMAYQDLKFDENHYLWRKGVNVADDLTIQEYQRINVGYRDKEDQSGKWTNDPLMIHRMQWSNSYQADRYQPTIRLGYGPNSYGHAGVTFLWDQVKPFGDRDISDLGSIWFNGQRFVFGWASHKRMFGNQQQPAFMRLDDKGEIMSGIAFTPGSTWDLGSGAWNITASVMNNGG